ncbi:DgyrCDS7638 [Dimorphilus gyrociliatus]|uniref:DgyrCDS7638 n=1 Tax=Dimorphilus gyrociliatus TaxID=2664684 RepID=A0A7I8VTV3_9ANNE|nr:DgyrCDS7638 [Dimorphilus gyrociliatus]
MGRYSKERHAENRLMLVERSRKQQTVPYLVNYTDSQDVIIKCRDSLSFFLNICWHNEMEGFEQKFKQAVQSLESGSFPRNDFMDIYKVTGTDIDGRRVFMQFMEQVHETVLTRFVQGLRSLPALHDLDFDEFCRVVIAQKDEIHFIIACSGGALWKDNRVIINLDADHSLEVSREDIVNFSDESLVQCQEKISSRAQNINMTFEETAFIVALNALKPTVENPHFKRQYERFTLAFTRYLQSVHGKNYHKRLFEIIDFVSYTKVQLFHGVKNIIEHMDYIKSFYRTKLVKDVLFEADYDKCLNMLNFHYGANTCEACKIFYRRSLTRPSNYVCVTKKNLCFPGENFRFACKKCRFDKCVEIGMSKDSIKIGRYSLERHEKNRKTLKDLKNKSINIPYLPIGSDSQDIVVLCQNCFSLFPIKDWTTKVDGLREKVLRVNEVFDDHLYNSEQFMDIYETVGVEIDNRRVFAELFEMIITTVFNGFSEALINLPIAKELQPEDFFSKALESLEDVNLIMASFSLSLWKNDSLAIPFDDNLTLNIPKSSLAQIVDVNLLDSQKETIEILSQLHITFEEAIFITTLNFLKPTTKYPQLHGIYERFTLAFTRYLENKYGSSFHYGAYTCEGCKVFFTRSSKKYIDYVCLTNRKQCVSNTDYAFSCKFCRYKKCLAVGMSRGNIKIGRYSKRMHEQKDLLLTHIEKEKLSVPYLPKYTDSHNMIIACRTSFNNFFHIDWGSEIQGLNDIYNKAKGFVDQGTFSKDEYMDIYKVTGIEVDSRKAFVNFTASIMHTSFKVFFSAIRSLPIMDSLSLEDVYQIVLRNKHDMFLLITVALRNLWSEEKLIINLNDKYKISLNKSDINNLSGNQVATAYEENTNRIINASITYEEAILMIALNMSTPIKKYPNLKGIHERLTLAFTRYLEANYGKTYYVRLAELVNLMASMRESFFLLENWMTENEEYLNIIYQSDIMKIFFMNLKLEQAVELLMNLTL